MNRERSLKIFSNLPHKDNNGTEPEIYAAAAATAVVAAAAAAPTVATAAAASIL